MLIVQNGSMVARSENLAKIHGLTDSDLDVLVVVREKYYVSFEQSDAEESFHAASKFLEKIEQVAPGLINRL